MLDGGSHLFKRQCLFMESFRQPLHRFGGFHLNVVTLLDSDVGDLVHLIHPCLLSGLVPVEVDDERNDDDDQSCPVWGSLPDVFQVF